MQFEQIFFENGGTLPFGWFMSYFFVPNCPSNSFLTSNSLSHQREAFQGRWDILNKKLMRLLGSGANATAMEMIPTTLMADCPLITPTIDALWKCTTAIDVKETKLQTRTVRHLPAGPAPFFPPLASSCSDSSKF
jgi:hypothetical protein